MSRIIRSSITKIPSKFRISIRKFTKNVSTPSEHTKTQKGNDLSQFIIVKASKQDYRPALKVMHQSYYSDEPTCSCLGIQPNPVLDERTIKDMTEGMTLLAKQKQDGKIVGACINCSLYPWDPEQTEKLACSCRCNKLKSLLLFYAHITKRPDLWKAFDVRKIFEIEYVFVVPEHRRKGISMRYIFHVI